MNQNKILLLCAFKLLQTTVQADRRARGVRPTLPRPEERETIKAEYMKQLHKPKR